MESYQSRRRVSVTQEAMINLKTPDDLKIPQSGQSFLDMVLRSLIFVDKTRFILYLLNNVEHFSQKTYLITRPRRWGKSMLISMLFYFFTNIQLIKQSNDIPYSMLFEGGDAEKYVKKPKKLKPLKIASHTQIMKQHQGKYPVIYMKWYASSADSFGDTQSIIFDRIIQQFEYFRYVLSKLNEQQAQSYNSFLKNTVHPNRMRTQSLIVLSRCLKKYHGKKVIILIDEFDYTYRHALSNKCLSQRDRSNIALLLTEILQCAFKHNNQLFFGIATGIYDMLIKSQSGLNDTKIDSLASPIFVESLGFKRQQIQLQLVDKMFQKINMVKKDQIMSNIDLWYDGYFYEKPVKDKLPIQFNYYNPYSVTNYLVEKCAKPRRIEKPQAYWTQTSSNHIIGKVISVAENHQLLGKIFALVQLPGQSHKIKEVVFSYSILDNLSSIKQQQHESYISYLLFHTGYITGTIINGVLFAKVANFEIYDVFVNFLKEWMSKTKIIEKTDLQDPLMVTKLMHSIYNSIKKKLGQMNERPFNGLFYVGCMLGSEQTHTVNAQLYAQPNYTDQIYFPKKQISNAVVIHELKYQESPYKKEQMSEKALWQIFEKDYMSLPLSQLNTYRNIERIIVRGITIVETRTSGEREMIADISPDQEFSVEEAKVISWFCKRHKSDMASFKDKFFTELNKKNSFYLFVITNLTQLEIKQLQQDGILTEKQLQSLIEKRSSVAKAKQSELQKRRKNKEKREREEREQKSKDLKKSEQTSKLFSYNEFINQFQELDSSLAKTRNQKNFIQRFTQNYPNMLSLFQCKDEKEMCMKVKGCGLELAKEIKAALKKLNYESYCYSGQSNE